MFVDKVHAHISWVMNKVLLNGWNKNKFTPTSTPSSCLICFSFLLFLSSLLLSLLPFSVGLDIYFWPSIPLSLISEVFLLEIVLWNAWIIIFRYSQFVSISPVTLVDIHLMFTFHFVSFPNPCISHNIIISYRSSLFVIELNELPLFPITRLSQSPFLFEIWWWKDV